MPARRRSAESGSAFTYIRVSTEEQAQSGLGLDAQQAKVTAEVKHKGWHVVGEYADEGYSAKSVVGRPSLTAALAALDEGKAEHLVVAKLDRLSRSVHDFTGLMVRAERRGWHLAVIDLGLDTSTPNGKFMAHVLASVAELERDLIAERTSLALQALKRQGKVLGRPDRVSDEVVARIRELRDDAGYTLREVAAVLNDYEVPRSQGGQKWWASSVAAVLARPA